MQREMLLRKIEHRILGDLPGTMFITSDFTDIASSDTANRALLRLEKGGIIRKIMRGIYEKPKYSEFLEENIAPSPDKVANAIARKCGWRIVPNGDTALNMLGLSTQVPAVWMYVSDGPYKEYEFDGITLKFKHTANKEISNTSYKTALVIQALKAIGKERVTSGIIQKISKLLTEKEKQNMINEAQYTTAWIYDVIKEIYYCEVSNEKYSDNINRR